MQADYESAPTALALVHRQIVDRFGNRAIRVYEAGGGSRSCLPRQVIERSDIVVVDIDETQLQNNNYATKKIFGDIQTQSFQSNSFDLIVCYNVIEHLPAPHEAIRRFSAALSPNGLLVIGAPDPRSLYGMVTRFTPHWFHVWYYRTLLCSPNAGRPGHEPFPVFYHPTVEPHALMEFAKGLGLRPLLHHHYESPTIRFLQEKRPLVGASMRAAVRFLNLFAINGRNFGHGDYHVVFEKIG